MHVADPFHRNTFDRLGVIVGREFFPEPDPVGFDERADYVDPDIVPAPFQRSDFREATDGFFGGGVAAPLGFAAGAGARAEVDDRPATGRDHQRGHGLHQQETGPRPDLVTPREVFAG